MDTALADLALRKFVAAARSTLEGQGLSTFWYHTTSQDPKDPVISMGGVQPDTGRNVYGLRHTISMLIETRGTGIGRAHFARRVHSHVLAALEVLRTAGQQGSSLLAAVKAAGQTSSQAACKGDLVIRAQVTPGTESLEFVDAKSGEDRAVQVPWRSALALTVEASRSRPCGYWLSSNQTTAVGKLLSLGVRVERLTAERMVQVERYRIVEEKGGLRQDARGAIPSAAAIRELTLATEPLHKTLPAGSWYVPLDQAFAAIAAAALEPDSQSSFGANHVMGIDESSLLRVVEKLP